MKTSFVSYLAMAVALGFAGAVNAQETGQEEASGNTADTQSAADASQQGGVGYIVVTAQRVEQTAQSTALAINVVDPDALTSAGITDVSSLDRLVPGLDVQLTGAFPSFFLRGVGNFTATSLGEPAVALNYDGVYVAHGGVGVGFFDLERVEVLKGPQGTLYGRNATGGAVNVIPARPKLGEFSGNINAEYGRFDRVRLGGSLNVPLTDNSAFRVATEWRERDGYLSDGTSDEDTFSIRGQYYVELAENIDLRVAADFTHQGGAGQGASYVGRYQFTGPGGYLFIPSGLDVDDGLYSAAAQAFRETNFNPISGRTVAPLDLFDFNDNEYYGVNAELNVAFDAGTLTIVPAWRLSKFDLLSSVSGFQFGLDDEIEQLSLEARFAGERIGMFDYLIGAYVFNENVNSSSFISVSAAFAQPDNRLEKTSLAPFGRVTAHVSDTFRITGGVRYTYEDQSFFRDVNDLLIICTDMPAMGPPMCPGAPQFPQVFDFDDFPFAVPPATQPPSVLPVGGGAIIQRVNVITDLDNTEEQFTWRAAVEWDAGPDSLIYASAETGFRAGGFSGAIGFETFDPETLIAYTIGTKNRFLNNNLLINLEGFYWKYDDQQVSFTGVDANGNPGPQIRNIGSTDIRGFELEAQAAVTPDTLISTNIQFLDTEVKEFVFQAPSFRPPPVTGCPISPSSDPLLIDVNCAGFPAYSSPRWTVNIAAQHRFALGALDLVVAADTQYRSSRYISFGYSPQTLLSPVWRSNAQITLEHPEAGWSLTGFVQNIEDDRSPTLMFTTPLLSYLTASPDDPRVWGVRAAIDF